MAGCERGTSIVFLYLLGIAAAELVTTFVSTVGGIAFHLVLLFCLILHSSLAAESSRKPYLALAIAPLTRIVSLSMPLSDFTQIYQYLLTSIPLFVAIFVAIRLLNFGASDVSFRLGKLPVQGLVALTGIGFGIAEYYILRPEPLISTLTLREVLLPALILLVATGFVEELAFRGVIQRAFVETFGPGGWVYVAVLSSVLYIGYLSAMEWFFMLVVGLFFGWIVQRTGSLLGVVLSHGIANICLYLVIPLTLGKVW